MTKTVTTAAQAAPRARQELSPEVSEVLHMLKVLEGRKANHGQSR